MIRIASSANFPLQLPEGHRFPGEKYQLVQEQLLYEGAIQKEQIFYPEFPSAEILRLTHQDEYLHKINTLGFNESEIRKIGFPNDTTLRDRSLSSSGGTLSCALFAIDDGISMNLAGGTHHAFYNYGEGYCVLNDIAIASNYLLQSKNFKKILIVDLDVHQGNGSASLFRENDKVFTFSMHAIENYPLKKEKSDLDIPLATGMGDFEYLSILKSYLSETIEKVKPAFIFYQSGTDIIQNDRLGKLNISIEGCYERDLLVFYQAKKYDIPIVSTMGGGYNKKLNVTVNSHVNTIKAGVYVFS